MFLCDVNGVLRRISSISAIRDDQLIFHIIPKDYDFTQFHVVRECLQVFMICLVLVRTDGDFYSASSLTHNVAD